MANRGRRGLRNYCAYVPPRRCRLQLAPQPGGAPCSADDFRSLEFDPPLHRTLPAPCLAPAVVRRAARYWHRRRMAGRHSAANGKRPARSRGFMRRILQGCGASACCWAARWTACCTNYGIGPACCGQAGASATTQVTADGQRNGASALMGSSRCRWRPRRDEWLLTFGGPTECVRNALRMNARRFQRAA